MKEQSIFFMDNPSTDPFYNLALEEYILTHRKKGTYFLFWQNAPTVVVGRNQNALMEINREYVKEKGIHVVRRSTGGGAVYHDYGNLNYSVITDRMGEKAGEMKRLMKPVIDTLRMLGADARFSGRNDIMVEDRKVSGNAQRIYKERILHHGCLLYKADLSAVGKALRVKEDKLKSKGVESVRSRVGNISDFLRSDLGLEKFKQAVVETLKALGDVEEFLLNEDELKEIIILADEKYRSWDWTYGKSPGYQIHNYNRFSGGAFEVYLNLKDEKIQNCVIYGDFMALRPIHDICKLLEGVPYNYEAVLTALAGVAIEEYLGSILLKEAVECICKNGS